MPCPYSFNLSILLEITSYLVYKHVLQCFKSNFNRIDHLPFVVYSSIVYNHCYLHGLGTLLYSYSSTILLDIMLYLVYTHANIYHTLPPTFSTNNCLLCKLHNLITYNLHYQDIIGTLHILVQFCVVIK